MAAHAQVLFLGRLIAAEPRVLDMIRSAATARLLPEQPLLEPLEAPVEAESDAFFGALVDDSENPTAQLYL